MKAAIYARYSSENQSEKSIDDQVDAKDTAQNTNSLLAMNIFM